MNTEKILKELEKTSFYNLPETLYKLYKNNEYCYDEEGRKRIENGIIAKFSFTLSQNPEEKRKHQINFTNGLEKALVEILRISAIYGSFFISPIVEIYKDGKMIESKTFCDTTTNSIANFLKEQIDKLKNFPKRG